MSKSLLALVIACLVFAVLPRPVGATELTLENGWAATSADAKAEAFVDEGIVYLKGSVSGGSSPILFTLPPSMRPAAQLYVTVKLSSFFLASYAGRLWIRPDGVAVVQPRSGDLSDATDYTSLDGVKFALNASGFTPLTLENGWVGAPFSTSAPAAALIDGIVHLKGGMASGAYGSTAFTLPPGMRPAAPVYVKTSLCNVTAGTLSFQPSGAVTVSAVSDAQCFTSLDGVSFAPSANGFTPLPLLNDWTSPPSGLNDVAVSLVDGIVRFKGSVSRAEFDSSLVAVLPPEMRPATDVVIATGLCGGDIGRIFVRPTGETHIVGGGLGFSCGADFDGASFVLPPPRTFQPVELLNGWTNGVFGTPPTEVVFYDGVAHFRGAVSNGATDHLFTLPVTLRPETNTYVSTDLCSAKLGRLLLQPSGYVLVQTESGLFADAQCFTSLEGVTYAPYATAFTPLTLANAWGDQPYGTGRAAAARIDGLVHLKGGLSGGTSPVLFTLPPELRPETNVYVSAGLCGAVKGRLAIAPSGIVEVVSTTTFAAAQCFTSLDGIFFATTTNAFAPFAPTSGWTGAPYGTHAPGGTIVRDIAYLEGAIWNGASPGTFVLPPLLRPAARVYESLDLVNGRKGRVIIEPSGSVSVFALGPFSDAQAFASFDGVSYSVPEPDAAAGLVAGLLGIAGIGVRRARRARPAPGPRAERDRPV